MDTLRLVDAADDGRLVLASDDGRRFVLPVDAALRSAVRTHRAPEEGRGERQGPREVQALIRAGADAEEVAESTGLSLDYVRRFEGPVLAERAHVADQARRIAVHRDLGAQTPLTLESAVLGALTDLGHDPERAEWDSRRIDGTRWEVELFVAAARRTVATPAMSGAAIAGAALDGEADVSPERGSAGAGEAQTVRATWCFDTATRTLEELDDTARRLTALDRRRLSAVRGVFDIDAGRGRRTGVPGTRAAEEDGGRTQTAELLESLALQRGRRPEAAPLVAPGGRQSGDDEPAGRVSEPVPIRQRSKPADAPRTPEAATALDVPVEPALLDGLDLDDDVRPRAPARRPARVGGDAARSVPGSTRRVPEEGARTGAVFPAEPAHPPAKVLNRSDDLVVSGRHPAPAQSRPDTDASQAAARRRSRRRTTVPSWDDIVFGARPDE